MKDAEIEDLLRKFRPVGPPAELRQRVLDATRSLRIWPWTTAAAVLLAVAVTFRLAAENETTSADVNPGPSTSARVTEHLTGLLGGDLHARALAELIILEQQLRTETTRAVLGSEDAPGGIRR